MVQILVYRIHSSSSTKRGRPWEVEEEDVGTINRKKGGRGRGGREILSLLLAGLGGRRALNP